MLKQERPFPKLLPQSWKHTIVKNSPLSPDKYTNIGQIEHYFLHVGTGRKLWGAKLFNIDVIFKYWSTGLQIYHCMMKHLDFPNLEINSQTQTMKNSP